MRATSCAVVAGLFAAACGPESGDEAQRDAELVLTHGRIYTVDRRASWAEAVAIAAGRFVYVGDDDGVRSFIGPATDVVDLGGRMVLPGIQDAHIHPISSGVEASACNLNDLDTLADYRSAIAACAADGAADEWLLGGGWLMSVFGPGGAPDKMILDEIAPGRPVYLTSADAHSAWVNSRALEIAGIDAATPDPADGRIDRDPVSGEPVGALQEGAMALVRKHVPPTSAESRLAGLRYSVRMLNGYGITAVQDANVDADDLDTYLALEREGDLSLSVVASLWWRRDRGLEQIDELVALRQRLDGRASLIRPVTVKIMQDGVMENYTAVLLEPYLRPGGGRGLPMVAPELLAEAVTELDARGFQVHLHAIGDGAIRQSLDAIEVALESNGPGDRRHHIAHLQLIDPEDIPRFQALGVVANFQPLWAYADDYVTELTAPYLGEARMRWMYPIRSVADTGAVVAFGSDWSVSTANPFPQIEVAVRRTDPWDPAATDPFVPEERISLAQAIAAFTRNAAYVNHSDHESGSIEIGKFADLAVLDQNLFGIPPAQISETRVLLTLFRGRIVHGAIESL